MPGFDFAAFERIVKATPGEFPVRPGQTVDELLAELQPVMFDRSVDAKLVTKSGTADVLASSAVNFYDHDLTQAEVAAFYAARKNANDSEPVSLGLNSTLVRRGGVPVEQVWKVGGRYTQALEHVVSWLEKAVGGRRERCATHGAREARGVLPLRATSRTGTHTTSLGSRTRTRSST